MALYDKSCPSCGRVLSKKQTPIREAGGFPCPYCGQKLKSSVLSPKLTLPVTFISSTSLCLWFGLRGTTAIITAVIAALPIYFVVYVVIGLIAPPGLKLVSQRNDSPSSREP
jgi:hypothetical protein